MNDKEKQFYCVTPYKECESQCSACQAIDTIEQPVEKTEEERIAEIVWCNLTFEATKKDARIIAKAIYKEIIEPLKSKETTYKGLLNLATKTQNNLFETISRLEKEIEPLKCDNEELKKEGSFRLRIMKELNADNDGMRSNNANLLNSLQQLQTRIQELEGVLKCISAYGEKGTYEQAFYKMKEIARSPLNKKPT